MQMVINITTHLKFRLHSSSFGQELIREKLPIVTAISDHLYIFCHHLVFTRNVSNDALFSDPPRMSLESDDWRLILFALRLCRFSVTYLTTRSSQRFLLSFPNAIDWQPRVLIHKWKPYPPARHHLRIDLLFLTGMNSVPRTLSFFCLNFTSEYFVPDLLKLIVPIFSSYVARFFFHKLSTRKWLLDITFDWGKCWKGYICWGWCSF